MFCFHRDETECDISFNYGSWLRAGYVGTGYIVWRASRLLQRYQNVKAELEAQQNLERIRMEKLAQSGGLTSTASHAKTSSGSSTVKSKSGSRQKY